MHTQDQSLIDDLALSGGGVPIYVQLRDQILRALGEGRLRPGDQMPTMRQLAVALRIDLNTARRAYDELEAMGAIRLERGRGSFVADPPAPPSPDLHAAALDEVARQAIGLARARGVQPLALAQRIASLAQASKETLDG
jgi:GntR family transcriptional regulator